MSSDGLKCTHRQMIIDTLATNDKVDIVLYDSIDNQQLLDHIKQHGVVWWCRLGESRNI